jgi:hypothetical protein
MSRMSTRRLILTVTVMLCAGVGSAGVPLALAGAAQAAECPNEALRAEAHSTQLAQCRAYEQVSPVETEDSGVLNFYGAAPDGKAAEFVSAGGFAGIGSDYAENHYISRRSAQGWRTSWVGVPAALRGLVSGVTSSFDLSKQVARVKFLTGAQAGGTGLFFSDDLADAPAFSFAEVPEYDNIPGGEQPSGESPNFSHIVITGANNGGSYPLYELAGVGGPMPVLRTVTIEPPPNEGNVFDGELGNGEGEEYSLFHAISNDGAEIFFTNKASGMSYVRVNGSETIELGGLFQGASEDGVKVFLKGAGGELYMDLIDSEPGHEAVSETVSFAPAGQSNTYLRSGDDGSHVYFDSTGVLTGEEKNENGGKAEEGKENLYVYDTLTGKTAFIAQALPGGDIAEGQIEAQVNGCPSAELGEPIEPGCEGGRFFVFTTTAHVTPGDTGDSAQVFEYDAGSGSDPPTLVRISTGEAGYAENGNGNARSARIAIPKFGESGNLAQAGPFEMNTRAVSDDGSTVIFSSSGALSPRAVNDLQPQPGPSDIYEWHEGVVSLISTGHSLTSDIHPAITPSGRDIFFTSTEGIVPQDTDGLASLYDARIDGGFAAAVVPAGGCNGDACQGPPSVPNLLGAGASATFSGLSNPAPAAPTPTVKPRPKARAKQCRKGYVKKKGRCVKKAKAKRAGNDRRVKR